MVRQWLSPPEAMCQQHLLGEHFETHIFVSKMIDSARRQSGTHLKGFRDGSMFFGAEYVQYRHNWLASFIQGHASPLFIPVPLFQEFPKDEPNEIDWFLSVGTLISRCGNCRERHNEIWKEAPDIST